MYQFVLDQLEESKGTWPAIAEATGISRSTIVKIARQEVSNPGVTYIERLAAYFRSRPAPAAVDSHPG